MVHFLKLNTSWAIWLTIMNNLLCHQSGLRSPACNHVLLLAGTSLTIGLLSTFLQRSFRNKGNLLINPIDLKATVINAFSLLLASKLFESISYEPPLITKTPPHSIGFPRKKAELFESLSTGGTAWWESSTRWSGNFTTITSFVSKSDKAIFETPC